MAEAELRKVTEEYRKLREELLPVFRWAKDRSQPLPYQPSVPSPGPDHHGHDGMVSPILSQNPQESKSKLGRTLSKRLFVSGGAPKTNSPTHIPQSIPEDKAMANNSNLNPSAAANEASSHLAASLNGGSQPSTSPHQPSIPSPTSPNHYQPQSVLTPHSYTARDGTTPNSRRTQYPNNDENLPHTSYASSATTLNGDRTDRSNPTPTPGLSRPRGHSRNDNLDELSSAQRDTSSAAPSVEIFKSFRVSMDDPCWKVLPEALKKYHINADWRQYALYIVFGDQERCLGLEEKPLILFKQLDKEGRKPMFMLRRHAAPVEGHSGPSGGGVLGSAAFDPSMSLGSNRTHQSAIQLPGGVL